MAAFNHEDLQVFFRGKFVHFKDATLSIANTGFLYGLGVFTGIRAHVNPDSGKLYIFRLADHYRRLHDACKLCYYSGFLENYDYKKFETMLVDLVRINKLRQDVYIRVTNFTDENIITPKFVVYKDSLCAYLYPLGDYVPTSGMRCKVSSWTRVDDNSIPARAKLNGSYVNTAFAKSEALRLGFDEAIFLDRNGHVVEGSAENIFLVMRGALITPPVTDNILEGITRDSIMQIARNEGLEVIERSIDRTELYKADEVFLTGTGAKVSPVIEIDQRVVGKGKVGEVCQKIQDIYFKAVKGEDPRYMLWLTEVPAA